MRHFNTTGAIQPDIHLVVFDRTKRKAWSKKIFRRTRKLRGATIKVWGM